MRTRLLNRLVPRIDLGSQWYGTRHHRGISTYMYMYVLYLQCSFLRLAASRSLWAAEEIFYITYINVHYFAHVYGGSWRNRSGRVGSCRNNASCTSTFKERQQAARTCCYWQLTLHGLKEAMPLIGSGPHAILSLNIIVLAFIALLIGKSLTCCRRIHLEDIITSFLFAA